MNALLVCVVLVLIFTAVCALRAIDAVREFKEEADAVERWWEERAEDRRRLNIRLAVDADQAITALEGVARQLTSLNNPTSRTSSGIADDSPDDADSRDRVA